MSKRKDNTSNKNDVAPEKLQKKVTLQKTMKQFFSQHGELFAVIVFQTKS